VDYGDQRRMSTRSVNLEYGRLLTKFSPRVIRTEKANEEYTEALYELDQRNARLTRAEKELAELLTLLIEDFESKRYKLPRAKPVDILRFLMDQHGLKQKDLADVFGTRSIVSEVLSGKRKLNREHIQRLSERFHVSPLFPAMRTRIIDEGFGPYWHLCRRIWIETPGENSCDAYRCGWFLRSWLCMRVALGRRRRLLRHLQRRSASA
jgi:HTH-type transcriptional regulator/antitoxin HigA